MGSGVDVKQRVAVRRCALDVFGPENSTGAALILNDEGLSQRVAHPICHNARRRIGDASSRGRNHHLDRTIRIGVRCLGMRGADQRRGNGCYRRCPHGDPTHAASPRIFLRTLSQSRPHPVEGSNP